MSALAFQFMKFAGAAYLLYLAWLTWKDTGGLSFNKPGENNDPRLWQIAKRGFLINILNPKLSIFFLAFLPLFVPQEASNPTLHMITLSVVFMAMTFVVFIAYGLCASGVRHQVISSPKIILWLQRSFAIIFAALGLRLAAAEQ